MYRVVLIFGDTEDLANFLLSEPMRGVETNSVELTLSGILTKKQVDTACKNFGAYIRIFREVLPSDDV
jgi:hypothetical protein